MGSGRCNRLRRRGAGAFRVTTAIIEIRGLTYDYPDGTSALAEVHLRVDTNERIAIVGANGAGKSTLLRHIAGLVPSRGCVLVEGCDPSRRKNPMDIGRVGLVFQDPDDQLFCTTVGEDVAFGPRNQRLADNVVAERMRRALADVGLGGLERRVPHHLSLGQKKRVAIAAVLAMSPRVLALDEPTGHLDPRGRREIAELLAAIGGTQIVATHDFDLARRLCNRAVVMKDGRIVAEGSCSDVLADAGLMARADLV
ncbi:MAG: energy-coupling factor ABC transporter ATP-binding protein [Deltaproteobacteria bacterium]|nr:energy-coupling factor ABC transporter ATP-binding protein [Deltaproteobacteria bacterium]